MGRDDRVAACRIGTYVCVGSILHFLSRLLVRFGRRKRIKKSDQQSAHHGTGTSNRRLSGWTKRRSDLLFQKLALIWKIMVAPKKAFDPYIFAPKQTWSERAAK